MVHIKNCSNHTHYYLLLVLVVSLQFFQLACSNRRSVLQQELSQKYWERYARAKVAMANQALQLEPNKRPAKSVILFIGDGMGPSTVTAARHYKAQKKGQPAGTGILVFDSWLQTAFVKTHDLEQTTTDSASSATAFLCGTKTRTGFIGVTGTANNSDCGQLRAEEEIKSILDHFRSSGRRTGIVTTTRLTHATPAAAYAKLPHRDWESDVRFAKLLPDAQKRSNCKDIAAQLVGRGAGINVLIGGGRKLFRTIEENGEREDGRDLVSEWKQMQNAGNKSYQYISDGKQLKTTDLSETEHLLALIAESHLPFDHQRDEEEPSLAELVKIALKVLTASPHGYFLLVEGGRIDHAHHSNQARVALEETLAFDEAIKVAEREVDLHDTLLVVTADHSHTFTIGGQMARTDSIFDIDDGPYQALDDMPYTDLAYANGPSAVINNSRQRIDRTETKSYSYMQQSLVPLAYETHGGEDVQLFATGRMSTIFRGTLDNTEIAHRMMFASCVGPYKEEAHCSSATVIKPTILAFIVFLVFQFE